MAEIHVESGRWECYYGLLTAPMDTSVIVDDVSSKGVPPCAPRCVHLAVCISPCASPFFGKQWRAKSFLCPSGFKVNV